MKGLVPVARNAAFSGVRHTSDKLTNPSDVVGDTKLRTYTNKDNHGVRQPFMFHYSDCDVVLWIAAGPYPPSLGCTNVAFCILSGAFCILP